MPSAQRNISKDQLITHWAKSWISHDFSIKKNRSKISSPSISIESNLYFKNKQIPCSWISETATVQTSKYAYDILLLLTFFFFFLLITSVEYAHMETYIGFFKMFEAEFNIKTWSFFTSKRQPELDINNIYLVFCSYKLGEALFACRVGGRTQLEKYQLFVEEYFITARIYRYNVCGKKKLKTERFLLFIISEWKEVWLLSNIYILHAKCSTSNWSQVVCACIVFLFSFSDRKTTFH